MSLREERCVFGFFCLVNHDAPPHIELLPGYKGQSIHINRPEEQTDGSGMSKHPGRGKIIGTLTSVPFSGNNYFMYQNSSPPSHLMLEVPGCIIMASLSAGPSESRQLASETPLGALLLTSHPTEETSWVKTAVPPESPWTSRIATATQQTPRQIALCFCVSQGV